MAKKTFENMVKEFHEKFDVPIGGPGFLLSAERALLRVRLIQEESSELTEAVQTQDYVAMAKEAADLIYVVIGQCVEAGIPITEVFNAVHEANMTKTGDKDAGGKVVKGDDYVPANIALLLAEKVVRGQR
jgi:predicted HAD superfamily Cof-like phosphohydrolase